MKCVSLYKAAVAVAATISLASCGIDAKLVRNDSSISYTYSKVKDSMSKAEIDPFEQVFKLDISIKDGEEFPNKYVVEGFNAVMQRPELPTGCEVTALCSDLNYLGFGIDKVELADEFMPMDSSGLYTMTQAYIGDPKSEDGFGCYTPVIVQTADDYFASIQSPCYAVDLTGRSLKELFYQVAQGRPVIVWSTINMIITSPTYWWSNSEGEEMWFNDFQHCVVIYGYDFDENIVYVSDPLEGNITRNMDSFSQTYDLLGKQAVLICGDSKTVGKFVELENKPQSPILSRNKAERQANGA